MINDNINIVLAILDYIEQNKLLESNNFRGLRAFYIYACKARKIVQIEEEPQVIYDRKIKYEFKINEIVHAVEIPLGREIENIDYSYIETEICDPKDILDNLKYGMEHNADIIHFICLLFNLDVKK